MSFRVLKLSLFVLIFSCAGIQIGHVQEIPDNELPGEQGEQEQSQELPLVMSYEGFKKCRDYVCANEPETHDNYLNGIKMFGFSFDVFSSRQKLATSPLKNRLGITSEIHKTIPRQPLRERDNRSESANAPPNTNERQFLNRDAVPSPGRDVVSDHRRPLETAIEDSLSFISVNDTYNIGPSIGGIGPKIFDVTGDVKFGATAAASTGVFGGGVDTIYGGPPVVPFAGISGPLDSFGVSAGAYKYDGTSRYFSAVRVLGHERNIEVQIDPSKFKNIDPKRLLRESEREIEHGYFGVPSLWQ